MLTISHKYTLCHIYDQPHRWCNGERARLECGTSWVLTKDYTIGICCVSAKHAALRRKNIVWLARNQDNVSV